MTTTLKKIEGLFQKMQYPKEEAIKVLYSKTPIFPTPTGPAHILATPGNKGASWLHVILAMCINTDESTDVLGWMLACSTKHLHISRFASHGAECELFIFNIKAKTLYEDYIEHSQNEGRIRRAARAMGVAEVDTKTLQEMKEEIKGRF